MAYNSVIVISLFLLNIGGLLVIRSENTDTTSFDENYHVTWGSDHVLALNQGTQIQLSLDYSSGAGFASKLRYSSGFFQLRIKLPDRNSGGVVTAFYLTSENYEHDEVDFEFLGNREGKPYTLQTNVFANGRGGREQRITLWFDPTADYHTYKILRNNYQIVFFVDDIPIRVLKNNNASRDGVENYYPSKPMEIVASLWNGESWATDGGKTKIDWAYAPFRAHFLGFSINGCAAKNPPNNNNSSILCDSSDYFWNSLGYRSLDARQQRAYEQVKKKHITYDYCFDKPRYPTPPPECLSKP